MQGEIQGEPVRDRILLVDDSEFDRAHLRHVLERGGYDVFTADGADQAIALLDTAKPDLILLDVCMPGMDGYALCRLIRTVPQAAETPVIFVSANTESDDRVRAFASGGVDYLIKPIEVQEVHARIRTHLSLQALRRDLEKRVLQRTSELETANLQLVGEVAVRRAAEIHLRERNALISCLVNANIIGIMFLANDGTLVDANAAFVDLFEIPLDEIRQGRFNWRDLVVPEQRNDTLAAWAALAKDLRIPPVEKTCQKPDGSRFEVLVGVAKPHEQEGLIAFVLDLTERKQIEEALRESREHLRNLAAHGDAAMEEERKRIAREIHDEQGSLLTALKLDLSLLRRQMPDAPPDISGRLDSMQQLIDETVRVMREIASQLRPAALNLGLLPSLEWLASDFQKRTGIRCRLETACEVQLDDIRATALFRIVQESMTNITRHATASQVSISLENSESKLQVKIIDDGSGFDPAHIGKNSFGIRGIRERLELLGGELNIDSAPGLGTALHIAIPLERATP